MNDQFKQDPDEDLPDWLKDLGDPSPKEGEDLSAKSSEPSDSDSKSDSPKAIEADSHVADEPIDDSGTAPENGEGGIGEPEWLREIRQRHQKEIETNATPEPIVEGSSDFESLETPLEDEIESLIAAAPENEPSVSTPILEVPKSKERTEKGLSPDSDIY